MAARIEHVGMSNIHPTAIVSPKASIGADVTIGPFTIVHDKVQIGDGTTIESHCEIGHPTPLTHEHGRRRVPGQAAVPGIGDQAAGRLRAERISVAPALSPRLSGAHRAYVEASFGGRRSHERRRLRTHRAAENWNRPRWLRHLTLFVFL